MLSGLNITDERKDYLNFSEAYLDLDTAIITSTHNTQNLKLEDLHGRKVAIVSGYYWNDFLGKDHPQINIIPVPDMTTGLQETAFGTVDAFLATYATSSHYINQRGISNLRVAGPTPYTASFHFGIRKDWPILTSILDKALASISPQQQHNIQSQWIKLHSNPVNSLQHIPVILIASGIIFLMLLVSVFWTYSLRQQVKQQTDNLKNELAQHRLTQQELKQAKIELELRVEERTEELNATIEALIKSQRELEDANHQLGEMANNDGLTQIANRRHLDLALSLALGTTQEKRLPLTFMLGDIDFFKKYNDHYGHQAGDQCLQLVAHTLSEQARRNGELAARYGGEEFALLLPGVNSQEAKTISDEILQNIQDLEIEHEKSEVSPYISMSLGIISLVPDDETLAEDLIHWADKALYEAKHSGRNCARFAPPIKPVRAAI